MQRVLDSFRLRLDLAGPLPYPVAQAAGVRDLDNTPFQERPP